MPRDRLKLLAVVVTATILVGYSLVLLLDPRTSPFSSIRDSDGDGSPDDSDPYPDDPFDAMPPMVFVANENWDGFSGVCTESKATIDWEDVVVHLSTAMANATWSNLEQPTEMGPGSYTVLDCGYRDLGTFEVKLLAWNLGYQKGMGAGDYLYFKFAHSLPTGESFSVVLLQESTGSVLATIDYTTS